MHGEPERVPYALVALHYGDPAAARELIEDAATWSSPPDVIVVADNSSDFVFAGASAPCPLRVLSMGGNLGYGAAINRGIAEAGALGYESVLVMTQDCRLAPEAAELLLDVLAASDHVAAVGPLLVYSSRPELVFSAGGRLTPWGRTLHPGQGTAVRAVELTGPREADWLDGACLALRVPAVVEVGGFAEQFFLYVEEVELQLRLRKAGYRVLVVPRARASQEPGRYSLYYKYRNLCAFTATHRDVLKGWPWYFAWPKDSLRMLRKGRPEEALWAVRGLVDWRRGRYGPQPRGILGSN